MIKKVLTIIFAIIFSNYTSQAQVKHAGSMGEMGKNNFQGTIHLDSIAEKSTLYGLGPYGKMQGEITVVAGQPMIAEVKDGQLVLSKSWDIEAPFLVYTNVEEWKSITKNISIMNPSDLQEILESIAKQEGIDLSEPFPFRIFGNFDEITSHVVMPRSPEIEGFQAGKNQEKYNLQNIDGELLGFYSQQGQGIYTHKDSYIHVHFISEDKTIMGHLDDINVKNQTVTFMFPAKSGTIGNLKIKTNDTDFSKGRLGNIQEINMDDLVKFHGHLCDGLMVGFLGFKAALLELYPDGIIDRTNTRIVSKSPPCLTDIAVYLTGGRSQFSTFYVDNEIDGIFTAQRIDNQKAVSVALNPGVKPVIIDSLGNLANQQKLFPCSIDELRILEDDFIARLLKSDPKNIFTVTTANDFNWDPNHSTMYPKTDIVNRDLPKCNL